VVLGITLLGLNVLGATRILTIQSQTNRLQQSAAEQSFLPTASATPTPTAGPFPASGDGFSITSDPNSWVGQGTAFTYSREDAHFYWRPGGVAQPGVAIEVDYSDQIWTVVLVPPAGQTLQVRTYANAVEVPPTGTAPGLSVSGIGHACHSFGTFSVTAIAWDPDGQLNRLDATFLQHCGDPQGPIVSGRIRYIRP
jgi:hypothetical protein